MHLPSAYDDCARDVPDGLDAAVSGANLLHSLQRSPQAVGVRRRMARAARVISMNLRYMHELSLAQGIVEQAVAVATQSNARRIVAVRLRIGPLAGVESGALLFSYDIAAKDTLLEGSRLEIEDVPLVVWCAHCLREVTLASVQSLRCPTCQTLCGEIRQGRELEIHSVEIAT